MWGRSYRKHYYKRNYPNNHFEDLIDLIATLYIFYLGYQFFLDRANFWRWVIYGVITLISLYGILLAIGKFKNRRQIYFPYKRYFKPQPTPEAKKLGNLLKE